MQLFLSGHGPFFVLENMGMAMREVPVKMDVSIDNLPRWEYIEYMNNYSYIQYTGNCETFALLPSVVQYRQSLTGCFGAVGT